MSVKYLWIQAKYKYPTDSSLILTQKPVCIFTPKSNPSYFSKTLLRGEKKNPAEKLVHIKLKNIVVPSFTLFAD